MINFLHTFHPSPILVSLGPINIYWYGLFIVLAVIVSLTVAIKLARAYSIKSETMIDLAVWLIVGGVIGARVYDAGLEWQYFFAHPLDIFKIWQGGLSIHGGILGGALALWLFSKKHQQDFWQLAALIATALPLGQSLGRWGNYFNQELFGYPTNLAWGIPIELARRPWQYLNYEYFHPAFLYESLGNLLIFALMLYVFFYTKKNKRYELCVMSYAILYSLLRFTTEFIRLDSTPLIFGLRFPQLISLLIIIFSLLFLFLKFGQKITGKPRLEK